MKIYLIRHGEYVQSTGSLSEKGKSEIEQMANFLRPLEIKLAHIYHSGKPRAEETAAIFSSSFICENALLLEPRINPEGEVIDFASSLNQLTQDICLVGHLPFLGRLVSQLLVNDENKEIVVFQPGTIVCLEKTHFMKWVMNWALARSLFVL